MSWLLTNGAIWTGTGDVDALAISGDRIAAAGTEDVARTAIGEGAEVIDLGGRRVIPGLIDSHVHFLRAGMHWSDVVRWDDLDSLEDGLARIRERSTGVPPGTWIRVLGGWHPHRFGERRGPTTAELDAAAPDHPVYVQLLYEDAVLNGRAVEAASIDTEEGMIRGPAAFAAVLQSIPPPGVESQQESFKALMVECARFGLTGVVDPGGFGVTPDSYHGLLGLWRDRGLTLRVRLYHVPWHRGGELDDARYWVEQVEPGSGDDWLRHVGFGEVFTFGCHDLEGLRPFVVTDEARDDLAEIVRLLGRTGWPGHLHAILDSTIDVVLDVLEEVGDEIGGLPRFSLAHAEFIGERNLRRAAELGIGIAVQDRLVFRSADSAESWGEAAGVRAPPLRDMIDLGIPLGAGTDATVVAPIDPWLSLWWLVSGQALDGGPPREARHRLTRREALAAYTSGSAWFALDERECGTLEPGMLADLAVLSDDFFTVPVDEIPSIRSLLTMVGGQVVHADAPYDR